MACASKRQVLESIIRDPEVRAQVGSPGVTVAVEPTIADRPPHRSVHARFRIRLLPWMSGGKAGGRIRVQNAGSGNPRGKRG